MGQHLSGQGLIMVKKRAPKIKNGMQLNELNPGHRKQIKRT